MIHKTTRSILSVLLAALLLVTSIPLTPAFAGDGGVSLQSASGEGRVLAGDGTEDDPYQIATAADLLEFAELVNNGQIRANAVLTANIDLSSVCSEEKGTWTPIGNSSNEYRGTFNGAGHTISGLYIDSDADYQGLFGYVSGSGTVKDLTVSGNVSGDEDVGGVVGYNNGGTVTGCIFSGSGSVSGKISVGGVVGGNSGSNGVVENCYNTGTVTGTRIDDYVGGVGGVVGYNSGTVKNCYNTGKVTGSADSSDVGGVVGWNRGNVKNCYNTGSVKGDWYVGGVVGNNEASVTNCYNTGSVSGPDSGTSNYVGGVVGYNDGGRVENCYFLKTETVNKDLQGIGNEGSGSGGAAAVKDLDALCKALEDSDTWSISPFYKHPVLTANPEGGDGTKEHPYEIKTAAQLKTFRDIVNGANGQVKDSDAHAKLMNDIDLEGMDPNRQQQQAIHRHL